MLLRVDVAGLCHSDLHILDGMIPMIAASAAKRGTTMDPLALSHEIGGTIMAVGDGVDASLVGKERVSARLSAAIEGKKAENFLKHMMSEDFFEVGKFPTASLELSENKGGEMTGQLTVKGKTHPITFAVKQEGGKYVGKATFNRTKFGIIYRSGNFFMDLGDKVINDEVQVEFTIALKSA